MCSRVYVCVCVYASACQVRSSCVVTTYPVYRNSTTQPNTSPVIACTSIGAVDLVASRSLPFSCDHRSNSARNHSLRAHSTARCRRNVCRDAPTANSTSLTESHQTKTIQMLVSTNAHTIAHHQRDYCAVTIPDGKEFRRGQQRLRLLLHHCTLRDRPLRRHVSRIGGREPPQGLPQLQMAESECQGVCVFVLGTRYRFEGCLVESSGHLISVEPRNELTTRWQVSNTHACRDTPHHTHTHTPPTHKTRQICNYVRR